MRQKAFGDGDPGRLKVLWISDILRPCGGTLILTRRAKRGLQGISLCNFLHSMGLTKA